ncbi:MAG: hypothetical protein SGBAC_005109 [Bacillariaceae sp.]
MFKREIIDTSLLSPPPATKPATVLIANATCACGKVKARIQTADDSSSNSVAPAPIRLVCYCRDCRGYFETLNRKQYCKITKNVGGEEEEIEEVEETSTEPERKTTLASVTDSWGGVDWTCLYPKDIQIVEGKDLLKVVKIRQGSTIRHVYSTCCNSPMFRIGSVSMLVNSNVISVQENSLPISYRILGRQAWKTAKVMTCKADDPAHQSKPKMSWSVPIGWYFAMPRRIRSDLMKPMPLEFDENQVGVLEDFQEGSK